MNGIIGEAPICLDCVHFQGAQGKEGLSCEAFPEQIPKAILIGEHDHHHAYAGDHGIQFEAAEKEGVT